MKREPLVSVIVPIYNVEKYLRKSVDSIINQSYKNLEIILVDDGSPDSCPCICEEYAEKDSRVKVIHKENGGLSDARNAGTDIATGEYISYIDSDDWIDSETIKLTLEKMLEVGAEIGAFNVLVVYEGEQGEPDLSDEFEVMNSEQAIETTMRNTKVRTTAWNKIYKAEILKDLRFPKGRLNEDEFFTFRALDRAEKIVYIHRQCYYYFQRKNSIMGEYKINRLDMIDGVRLQKNNSDNAKYHTNWLNMIYPRLKLARELLSDDGVIFISIDDNEQTNLKKICDTIFGDYNFVGQITVVANPRGRDYGGVARMHDYIMVYKKSPETILNLIEDKDSEFKYFDEIGGFELRELRNRNIKFNKENRPNLYYPFYINPVESDQYGLHPISLTPINGWIELYPLESQGVNTVWRWGKEKSNNNLNINIVAKPMKNGSYMIVEKYRESRMMARSVWWDKDTNTEKGTLLVKSLMNGKVFDYPKPVEMIMRIIEMGSSDGDIVLDFFSGSATTAHAVMQMNSNSEEKRKFIMVQLPEMCGEKSEAAKAGYKNICEIGKERIRRAAKKIHEDNPDAQFDDGFKVFEVADTNIKWNTADDEEIQKLDETDYGNDKERIDFTKGYTDIDVVYEIMLRQFDIPLSTPVEKLPQVSNRTYIFADAVVVCLEPEITTELIEKLAAIEPTPAKFVLRDSAFNDDIQLKDVSFRRLSALIKNHQTEEERKSKYNNYTVEFI